MNRHTFLRGAVAAAGLAAAPLAGWSQAFPSRPIRIVLGVPPGTATDLTARPVFEAVAHKLGQPIVIDNKAAANGVVAAELVAAAPADGHTLLFLASSVFTISPHVVKGIRWNPLRDFTPVVEVGSTPLAFVVAANSPIRSLAALLSEARAHPGKLKAGMPVMSMGQFAVNMLEDAQKLQFLAVPYKGAAETMNAVLAGEIDIGVAGVGALTSQLGTGGGLRALAVTTTDRIGLLPQVPAVRELVPGFDAGSWFGLFGPAGMDARTVATLNKAVNEAIATPAMKMKLADLAVLTTGGGPEVLAQRVGADHQRLGALIQRAGVAAR